MKKFANFITSHPTFILIVGLLLFIPSVFGYLHTRINYDILVYLPDSVDTIHGEKILTNDFGIGSYAFVMVDMKDSNFVLKLEDDIRSIPGVHKVFSVMDVLDVSIPKDMLPDEILDSLYDEDVSIVMVTFDGSTSEDQTINAVRELRKVVGDETKVSSMTAMVLDTMNLSNQELLSYVVIAVVLCLVVLLISTNSYLVPIFLLGNIGIAIVYNMGTNLLFGQISYITKAIAAVLQLGVTTDFSIFLYHKYEQAKKENSSKQNAMSEAIVETFKAVIGSSLTTFVGFLALCTMQLTLGMDIGLVMAKGIIMGLICVLTIFPAMLLSFDFLIEKTKHSSFLPKFRFVQKFSLQHYVLIFVAFLFLLIPAYIGNKNVSVYYKLDDSLPDTLGFHIANDELAKRFGITSPEIIILDKTLKPSQVEELVKEIKDVSGVDLVIAPNTMVNSNLVSFLPDDLQELLENKQYQLVLFNSQYEIASDELNQQVKKIEKIAHRYDSSSIVAGEGALMKDLVMIADHDFKMVNTTSIVVIFFVMLIVLQSFGLPIVLIFAIEFGIFMNMAISYYMGVRLPFISSIVVGTIQLGATIDYAILMSTTYLRERHDNHREKKNAMENTLAVTVPSIITSAFCFFAATVGVSLFTKIDMIGSICTLLARGAIISMVVVILLLPALLMIFDQFIMKTTYFKKEEK